MSIDLESDLEKLQAEKEVLERLHKLKASFGLPFYRPYPKQDQFHRATARHRLFKAGNRTGKSTAGSAEDCAFLLCERPWYPKGDPARKLGIPEWPTKGIVVSTDWGKIDENFTNTGAGNNVGSFWKFLPKDFIAKTHKNSTGVIDQIWCKNGSVVYFETVSSFVKDPMCVEGGSWDWAHFDEPVPEGMFKGIARGGMDRGFRSWFTLTPLSELWIYDMFFPLKKQVQDVWVVEAETYDNIYLSKENIEAFIATLTPEEKECRIYGKPMELSGLIYKQFRIDKHVLTSVPHGWEDYNKPPKNYIIYVSIDTHDVTPHAVLFVAVSPQGYKFIFDELFIRASLDDLVNEIRRIVDGYEVGFWKLEPNAWINDPITGTCLAEEFIKRGIPVEKSSKALSFGIKQMQNEFHKPQPNLYVSPNLSRFFFEIMRYVYDPKTGRPKDKDDHIMECMYRLFINEMPWYDPHNYSKPVDDFAITSFSSHELKNLDLEWT